MPDEIIEETPAPFVPVKCSLGQWVGVDGEAYLIATADGRTVAILANGDLTADNIEADIAEPKTPAVVVPVAVSPKQIRFALNVAGLRSSIDGAVASADQSTQDAWEYATEVRRDDALVNGMATALNLSASDVDALFISAAQY